MGSPGIEREAIVRALQKMISLVTTVGTENWFAFQTREKGTIVLCELGWVLDSEFFVISPGKNSAGLLLLPVKP